jgi:hypothetical protein
VLAYLELQGLLLDSLTKSGYDATNVVFALLVDINKFYDCHITMQPAIYETAVMINR